MALFEKKPKKLTLDEILSGIDNLSEDEKEKVHAKMQDLYKAEDEREIDKIEEDKAETETEADKKGEEVNEESEEIGKDVDEVETDVENDEGETVKEKPETEEETELEETKEEADDAEEKIEGHLTEDVEKDKAMDALFARFNALEEEHAELSKKYDALYSMLEDREKNGKFGLTPETPEETDETSGNKSVYSAYAGKNAHKYY